MIDEFLNRTSILALVACDASYFRTNDYEINETRLSSYPDNSPEDEYGFPAYLAERTNELFVTGVVDGITTVTFPDWVLDLRRDDPTTGFACAVFKKESSNEYIVAFTGTNGRNLQDWYSNISLAFTQWNEENRQALLEYLTTRPLLAGERPQFHFAGQSLGGALAQYAAYDYATILGSQFDSTKLSLVTFNGLGGAEGLTELYGQSFQRDRLARVNTAHYVVSNDIVHRLGGGNLNAARNTYRLDFRDPFKESPFNHLNPIAAHRIERGFYYGFDVKRLHYPYQEWDFRQATATSIELIDTTNARKIGFGFGNIFNNSDHGKVESALRLTAAIIVAIRDTPSQDLDKILLPAIDAAQLSRFFGDDPKEYQRWREFIPVAKVLSVPATAIAGNTLLFAIVWDAIRDPVVQSNFTFNQAKEFVRDLLERMFPVGAPSLLSDQLTETFFANKSSRDVLFACEAGLAFLGNKFPGGQAFIDKFGLDREVIVGTILSSDTWLKDVLRYIVEQAKSGQQNVSEALTAFSSGLYRIATGVTSGLSDASVFLSSIRDDIGNTVSGVLKAISNAYADFTRKYADPLFSWGGSVSFSELRRFSEEFSNAISSAGSSIGGVPAVIKQKFEQSVSFLESAGQTVVIGRGREANPFKDFTFDPDSVSPTPDDIADSEAGTYTLFLPYEPGEGGQRLRVSLQGAGADKFSVFSNGEEIASSGGTFELMVVAGRRQVSFALVAEEFEQSGALTVEATLVDADGVATHQTHVEANLTLTHEDDAAFQTVINGPFAKYPLGSRAQLLGSGFGLDGTGFPNNPGQKHTRLVGTTGADMIVGDHASEIIDAGEGHNYVFENTPQGPVNDAFREADIILTGSGDDVVLGNLGGSHVVVGDGDNVVKPYDGPHIAVKWLAPDGGVYTGETFGPVGHFYVDFAAALGIIDEGDSPLVGADGSPDLPLTFGFTGPAGGISTYFNFVPDPEGEHNILPFTRRDFGGGSSYGVVPNGNGSATLIYRGGVTEVVLRLELSNLPSVDGSYTPEATEPLSIEAGVGNDHLFGGAGEDLIQGGAGDDRIAGYAGDDTLLAGEGDDLVIAGGGDDYLDAGAGADRVWGEGGDDELQGGAGGDLLYGDAESTLDFEQGDDYLDGGAGDDTLVGHGGSDELFGGEGNDVLEAGAGDDTLEGELGDDTLWAGAGDDTLSGGSGQDMLDGGAGDDTLIGADGNDTLEGGEGNDWLDAGVGLDLLRGGDGDDTYVYFFGAGTKTIEDSGGEDTLEILGFGPETLTLSLGSFLLTDGNPGDAIHIEGFNPADVAGSAAIDRFVFGDTGQVFSYGDLISIFGISIGGTPDADVIEGTSAEDRIDALEGDDMVAGNAGDDLINGGAGADSMAGGAGDDRYSVDQAGDTVIENFEEGIDTVAASLDDVLGANVENLTLTADTGLMGTGNELDNVVLGNAGDDVLTGLAGNDTLDGGAGADLMAGGEGGDTYYVDSESDVTLETGGWEFDQVYSSVTYALGANIEALYFTGAGDIDGTGNELSNLIVGNDGANALAGMAGHDAIEGHGGNDLLDGGSESDLLLGAEGDDTLIGAAGMDDLQGGFGQDVLDGGDDNDRLDGGSGGDALSGGAGDDVYVADTYDDQVIEALNEGNDTVTSTDNFSLPDNVENLTLLGDYRDNVSVPGLSGDGNELDNVIIGNDGANFLGGEQGDDRIDGRAGSDFIDGGEGEDDLYGGNDAIFFNLGYGGYGGDGYGGYGGDESLADNTDSIYGGGGDDRADGGSGSDQIYGGDGNDVLRGGDDGLSVAAGLVWLRNDDLIAGEAGDDSLDGGSGDDQLYGGEGADQLCGGNDGYLNLSNNDLLDGGPGVDAMAGGSGDDIYFADGEVTYTEVELIDECGDPYSGFERSVVADTVLEDAGQGYDVVYASADLTLEGEIEELHLVGPEALNATGSEISNLLVGNEFANILDGGAGDDTLVGGGGDDTYVIDSAGDVLVEEGLDDQDAVAAPFALSLTAEPERLANIENVRLLGQASIDATGNDDGNVLTGNAGDNLLAGLAGNDTLDGGSGNDLLEGGEGDDVYIFKVGYGQDIVRDSGGAFDQIFIHGGLTFRDLRITQEGSDVVVALLETGDRLVLEGWIDATDRVELLSLCDEFLGEQAIDHAARNDAPLAIGDRDEVREDLLVTATGNVLGNDSDPNGTTLTVLNPGTYQGAYGVLQLGEDGLYSYALDHAAVQSLAEGLGIEEVFSYSISDQVTGNPLGASAELVVTVRGTNDLPETVGDIAALFEDDQSSVSGNVLANDKDIDAGDVLAVGNAGTRAGVYGRVTLAADGAYSYALDSASLAVQSLAVGQTVTDVFGYEALDGIASTPGALTISVTGVNDTPVLSQPIADQSAAAGTAFALTLAPTTFVDVDQGDVLRYGATHVDGSSLPAWLLFDAATQSFSGTPASGDAGTLQVRVSATDLANASATGDFQITVTDAERHGVHLIGTNSNDTLVGTDYDDIIDGRKGVDTMIGKGGDDLYYVDARRDDVIEQADGGHDVVVSSASYDLAANVEELWLTGSRDLSGTGNALDNVIAGNTGDNRLAGGRGSDVYPYERNGGDDVIEDAGGANDVLLFAQGITPQMVRLSRRKHDLVVDISGRNGSVTIEDWFKSEKRVERIQFADGRAWDEAAIRARTGDPGFSEPGGPDHHDRGRDDDDHHRGHHGRGEHGDRDDRHGGKGDRVADAVAHFLARKPPFDFEQAAEQRGPRSTPDEIARQWARVKRYVNGLAQDDDESRLGALRHEGASSWIFAATSAGQGWGFDGSIGAARGPENLKSLEGLLEGFKKL